MRWASRAKGYLGFLAATCGVWGSAAVAQPAASTDAVVRVVDIGAGLCVVIVVPDGHAMVYDAGRGGDTCARAVREMVPSHRIDLIVLSHSDSDHIGDMRRILQENQVAAIVHPGDPRGPTVDTMRQAIAAEHAPVVWNLHDPATPPEPGRSFPIGAATATFVAGWGDGHLTEGPGERRLTGGPLNNALSIVMRVQYGGHSVLLTGDTVGRPETNAAGTCQYAERIMAAPGYRPAVDSDVLVGQHHGADNSSAECFIRAASPDFVVFSAGHVLAYHHPRQGAFERIKAVRPAAQIFRTDRGDNEGAPEMVADGGRCADPPGDDDVEIRLPRSPTARVSVRYRGASRACP
jgi:competence protein ComEC